MMLIGPGPGFVVVFSLWPGWSRVMRLLPSGIFGTHMWRPEGERAEVSPPPGGAYRIFGLGYNQGAFFFRYFVNLS